MIIHQLPPVGKLSRTEDDVFTFLYAHLGEAVRCKRLRGCLMLRIDDRKNEGLVVRVLLVRLRKKLAPYGIEITRGRPGPGNEGEVIMQRVRTKSDGYPRTPASRYVGEGAAGASL